MSLSPLLSSLSIGFTVLGTLPCVSVLFSRRVDLFGYQQKSRALATNGFFPSCFTLDLLDHQGGLTLLLLLLSEDKEVNPCPVTNCKKSQDVPSTANNTVALKVAPHEHSLTKVPLPKVPLANVPTQRFPSRTFPSRTFPHEGSPREGSPCEGSPVNVPRVDVPLANVLSQTFPSRTFHL